MYARVFDIDGDGFPDRVAVPGHGDGHCAAQSLDWCVARGSKAGYDVSQELVWHVPVEIQNNGIQTPALSAWQVGGNVTATRFDVFDIDGDAIPDFVDASTTPWKVYRGHLLQGGPTDPLGEFESSYIEWNAPSANVRKTSTSYAGLGYTNAEADIKDVIDMNGDGLPDLVDASNFSDRWLVCTTPATGSSRETAPDSPHLPVCCGCGLRPEGGRSKRSACLT